VGVFAKTFSSQTTSEKVGIVIATLALNLPCFLRPQGQTRSESLAKFAVLALGLKCQPILQCIAVWLQNASQDKSRVLVSSLVNDYILVPILWDSRFDRKLFGPIFRNKCTLRS
jgi:hypothetical protein